MLKKNQIIIEKCIDYSYLGLGVVKHEGFCIFVRGMLIGEVGEIIITAIKKDYGYGRLVSLKERSVERRESPCPFYPKCGGCQLLHMSYVEQVRFKQKYIENLFLTTLKRKMIIEPIITIDDQYKYRNKVQIPIASSNDRIIGGFYRHNSHDIIEIDKCLLQSDLSNEIYQLILNLLNKYQLKDIVKHILIKHAFTTDQIMVVLIINQEYLPYKDEIIHELSKLKVIKSIILNINKRNDNVILGNDENLIYGDKQIVDVLMGYQFAISSKSFYQVNSIQTAKLYQAAYDMANMSKEDVILDLYCGIGTIGIIASQYVKEVIGIEIVKEAIIDAKYNAKLNDISNISFYQSDAKDS
ncbi:MAG: 23S rRNA (uracil(1939)-C(5))-methyltransferase RlmD, partial [Erysipelotrichaceae bacterium]|nr:23S rRNA (uracil(1939)-C(5))-methyltransferase RlmD [Erysipelotrichaceae bacterium]